MRTTAHLKLALLVAPLLVVACLSRGDESPVRIGAAHPFKLGPPTVCEFDSTINQFGGSLDLARGPTYSNWFDVRNELQDIETVVDGEPLDAPSRNDVYIKKINFSYAASNGFPFDSETVVVHSVIPPKGLLKYGIDLIGPKAGRTLSASFPSTRITADGGVVGSVVEPFELQATFNMSGNLGSGGEFTSNKVTFPITIYSSGFSGCPQPDDGGVNIVAPSGPCGSIGGQDGPIGCCSNPAYNDFCK